MTQDAPLGFPYLFMRQEENAMSRTVLFTSFLLMFASLLSAGTLSRVGEDWEFRSGSMALRFAGTTGAWTRLELDGSTVASHDGEGTPGRLKADDIWLPNAERPAQLHHIEQTDDGTVVSTVQFGEWELRTEYAVFPETRRIRRRATVTWRGTAETKLRGVALYAPVITADATGQWFFPGAWPPARRKTTEFTPGTRRNYSRSPVPLVYQYAVGQSVLCAHDLLGPNADNGSVTVVESKDGLAVSQAFDALARMKPGTSQSMGDAWLWFVEASADDALLRYHELLTDLGCVVPKDRPKWLESAVLYSLHPGGTIGSGFRDRGGFVPATADLDRIADLGCNAIWIMPVEDRSPYHPRDYYKFQEGLGSPEQYRALVTRAHELGLNVLQDIVPHGGSNTYPRAKAHPEWLVQEEDGSTLGYWCFDFNWPQWYDYMGDVARHYVRQYDVDGYRVDACGGSKIPNWNPEIPYGRASFAKLQGGLNMLRSLRRAVKETKPERGAILAESNAPVQGAIVDAIYDFDFCYSVLHGLRKTSPEPFVRDLSHWLHEQEAAGPAGLLRLRHIESHDSLRSQLWYGLEPQRALMALSVFIPGIPLVYDECEIGSSEEFRTMFQLRREFPELNGGQADYLLVDAPPGVFACLRSKGPDRSLVLINFNPTTALFANGESDLELPPFAYRILRRGGVYPKPEPAVASHAAPAVTPAKTPKQPVEFGDLVLDVDSRIGLPTQATRDGHILTKGWDLYLPPGCKPGIPAIDQTNQVASTTVSYGASTLRVLYMPQRITLTWEGDVPEGAALAIPLEQGQSWQAIAAEGVFRDAYDVRHAAGAGYTSSIYWHPQGGNVIWDSLQHPFPADRPGSIEATTANGPLAFSFAKPPARVRWFERIGDDKRLTAVISWNDPESPAASSRELVLVPSTAASETAARPGPSLLPTTGGWQVEHAPFSLRLGKQGTITDLGTKADPGLIHLSDLYTDAGFAPPKERYGASNDVEAYSRFTTDADGLLAQFRGRPRGTYRFAKSGTPIDYATDYRFAKGNSFRMRYAVRPLGNASGERAFLALYLPTPGLKTFRFEKDGTVIAEGTIGDSKPRAFQIADMETPVVPDRIVIGDGERTLYQLTDIRCGDGHIDNVFVHGTQFFITFLDTKTPPAVSGTWRWIEATVTPGDAAPSPVASLPEMPADTRSEVLLRDGSFESSVGQLLSATTGSALPVTASGSAWQAPRGGQLVSDPTHTGRLAAEVEGAKGDYRLWQQSLATSRLPEGSVWRLTAWVKGRDVAPGDISWQVPVIRFAVLTDKMTYVSSPPVKGTFDWRKVEVELTIPPALSSLVVQLGQNGSSGTLWIDDVKLERIDHQ
jgi:hypothetical protein